jgi:hypothetical protein
MTTVVLTAPGAGAFIIASPDTVMKGSFSWLIREQAPSWRSGE